MSELFAVFGVNWKLLAIQALNFGVLLFLLWHFLYKPVLRMIDLRRAKIEEGVRSAETAEKKLASSEKDAENMRIKAMREAEDMMAKGRAAAEEKKSVLMKEAEEKANALMAEGAARAEEAKRQALKESEREIARAAMMAAEKVLRQKSS